MAKIRKSIDSKDQISLCFHEKSKKTTKIMLLIKRVFYSCEDIVYTCDSLTDPWSIETFDNEIILVFEMIVCLNNPPSMISRDILTSPDATVFGNSISIPCVELVWDKFLCWLIDANIQKLELVRKILWYNNQLSYFLHILVSFLRCLDLWNYP